MTAFKSGHWDGRSSFYEMRSQKFPAGFVYLVQDRLTKLGHNVSIAKPPLPPPLGPERPVFDEFGYKDPNYDYQPKSVDRLIKHGMVIAQIATGGGKSRIAQMAVARIQRPTLFLTTRGVLMHQMYDHFVNLFKGLARYEPGMAHFAKQKVGIVGDSINEPGEIVTVGMVQTLAQRIKDPDPFASESVRKNQAAIRAETLRLLESFEFVILEEAHESSGDSFYEILRCCKNAHYRMALTATPFMSANEESNMRLMAVSGPIGIKVSEKQLIDAGILATPYFKYITPEKPAGLFRSTPWPKCYETGVVNSLPRNSEIIKEAIRGANLGLPVMILVSRQNHGKILSKALTDNKIKNAYIFGESDQETRKKNLKALESGKIQVLIGSTILDVGVDVPAIGLLINASGGKAEVQLRQRIGRGLRRKKSGPNVVFVIDFNDVHNNILMRHSFQRKSIVQETPGFCENILLSHQDFDFSGFER